MATSNRDEHAADLLPKNPGGVPHETKTGDDYPHQCAVDTDRVDDLAEVEAFAPLLASALRTLTHDQRRAVEMRVMQQMTYEAIASRLDCTQATARMRVSRGLRNLNRFMEGATI